MAGYIYKLTLISDTGTFSKGEVYIGKHNGNTKNYFSGGKIVKSIIKSYGKDVFEREILAKEIADNALLSYLEIFYIKQFNCNRSFSGEGLNLTEGGEGIFGLKRSEAHCKQISERMKKYFLDRRRDFLKPVYQYCIDSGVYLKTYKNATEAAIDLDVSVSVMSAAARGKNNFCKGFGWSYEKKEIHISRKTKNSQIRILQYDLNDNLIKEWRCVKDIEKEMKTTHVFIHKCCKQQIETLLGFKWKYKPSIMRYEI